MPDDDTREFTDAEMAELRVAFADHDKVMATVARIAVEDAELLRRLADDA
jgi:hypothetical protein